MVEYAANFTTTFQNTPSILEIIAEDSLQSILYPAIQKLILGVNSSSSGIFSYLYRHNEKILLIANSLLQYHYFKFYDSSFSENFYGLKRVFNDGQTLSHSYKVFCAIYLSFLPYLKLKITEKYNLYATQDIEGTLGNSLQGQIKKGFILIYPILQGLWGSWLIINYLKYMSGQQKSQSPILKLLDMKLIYAEVENSSFWISLFRRELGWADFRNNMLKNILISVLEVMAFSMQFSQSLDNIMPNFNIKSLPNISPPMEDNKSSHFKEKCPICRQYWKLPAVLPVSGYVFCFMCILKHLKGYQCCPVTKLPAKPLDIVRLFDGD